MTYCGCFGDHRCDAAAEGSDRCDAPMMALPRAKQNSVGPADRPVAVDVTFRPSLGLCRGLWEEVTLTCF